LWNSVKWSVYILIYSQNYQCLVSMQNNFIKCVIIALVSFQTSAQIIFEEGYFVESTGQRIDCLIRNEDWNSNPTKFSYKLNENADVLIKGLSDVEEFGITGKSQYVRATVDIDRSSSNLKKLSDQREPVFKSETLFLKVLIEGVSSLYRYRDQNLTRFFYKTTEIPYTQLIYKEYLVSPTKRSRNTYFQQQLYTTVNCPNLTTLAISRVDYTTKDLIKHFIKDNACRQVNYTHYEAKGNPISFNLALRPGLNVANLETVNERTSIRDSKFQNETTFRIGLEAEFRLPFKKQKWSLTIEPHYETYKSENYKAGESGPRTDFINKVDYQTLNLPAAIRYYSYLDQHSSLFYNAGFQFNFNLDSTISFARGDGVETIYDIKAGQNLFLGIGYKYKNKYGIEFRFNTTRDLLVNYISTGSNFKSFSVITSYTLL